MRFHAPFSRLLRWIVSPGACAAALALLAVAPPATAQLPPDPDSVIALNISVADGFTVTAVGDLIISRPVMQISDPGFTGVVRLLQSGDVTFGNFENTALDLRNFDGYPAAQYGGLRLRVAPEAVKDLKTLGFDMLARANNHTTDWGIEGLIETNEILDQVGLVHAGSGKTMAAARAGRFYETSRGRVGLVAMASSFTAMSPAMDPLGEIRGRPGLASLGTNRYYVVTREQLEQLRAVRDAQPRAGATGGQERQDELTLSGVRYKVGPADEQGPAFEMNERDLQETLQAIRAAKRNSDFVIATIHAHEPGNWSELPPKFLEELARQAIDAGADQFVGHGPHQVRGIEIYKGKPIFYSVGNFFYQVEIQNPLSPDIVTNSGLELNQITDEELLRRWMARSFPGPIWYQSVLTSTRFEGGRVAEIRLHPLELGETMRGPSRGTPRLASPEAAQVILERVQRLSRAYGTDVRIENGVGVIRPGRP